MPGFNERTFEFCYNAEFCQRFKALVGTTPNIPSLRAERELGYDVEFVLEQGGYDRSLFLQHKIANYAENRVGSNKQFYDCYDGPYFRFPIDNDQQNTLIDNYDPLRGSWMYCAPRFHRAIELEQHFRAGTIVPNSVWISPLKIGKIKDADRHNVTFDPGAASAFFHSEPRSVTAVTTEGDIPRELPRYQLTTATLSVLEEYWLPRLRDRVRSSLPDGFDRAKRIEQIQYVLGQVLGLTWFLLPDDLV